MKITEDNFIEYLERKDEDALRFVIKNYGGTMKAVINRILYLYPQDSEECLYDSIMKIWDNISFFDETKNSFRNWAAAVAKYTALNRLKQLTRLEPSLDVDELTIADIPHMTDNEVFNGIFMELISCLNDEDKALFIRIFWNGETIDESAKAMNQRKSNIYNRLSRAKKKIMKNNPEYFTGRNKYE